MSLVTMFVFVCNLYCNFLSFSQQVEFPCKKELIIKELRVRSAMAKA
jgi:hypothetical protein